MNQTIIGYEITIKRRRLVKRMTGQQWMKLGQEEKEREQRFASADPSGTKTHLVDVMGYTPAEERIVEESEEVFTQKVDDLSLEEVIKAINNIG